MTRAWRILTVAAASVCIVALVIIALNLPSAMNAGSNRAAASTAAAEVRVAITQSRRLKANLAILASLRQARQRKNAALADTLGVSSVTARP